jgi:GxxExxY protein
MKSAKELNVISETIIGAAIAVHRKLGPGLLENTYEACLAFELTDRGCSVLRQKELPEIYRGVRVDCGYRLDLLVNESVIVELKSVERFDRIHQAQVMSYLKLTNLCLGLLINFNVELLVNGIKRIVRAFPEDSK